MRAPNTVSLALPFQNMFPGLQEFTFFPWTNWEGPFQNWFSPHIVFGSNIEDKPVEEHVLQSVGSYGKQLSCIIDAMSVLVSVLDHQKLTPEEQHAVALFKDLKRDADAAVAEVRGKTQSKPTMAVVDDWIDALLKLKKDNPNAYARLVAHLKDELPPADGKQ